LSDRREVKPGMLEVRSEVNASALIAFAGELDLGTVPQLEAELEAAESSSAGAVVLDLRDLTFMDSSGLRVILLAAERARGNGRRFALVRGPDAVNRVFEVTGTDAHLEIVEDPSTLA
jgi:anti-sigma B factor antagonist